MPKINNNINSKLKKTSKFRRFLIIIFWIIVCVIILIFGRFLSYLLTGANFKFSVNTIKTSELEFYVLSFGEFDNIDDAKSCAIWLENSGGAGYIYKSEKYMVVGRTYFSMDDAKKVKENMGTTRYDSEIKTIRVKPKKVVVKDLNKSDKKAIIANLHSIEKIIKKVDEVDRSIDRNGDTNVSASGEINSLKTTAKEIRNNINRINVVYANQSLNKIISFCNSLEDSLDLAVNKLLVSKNELSVCKYLLSEIQLNYANLLKDLS